jgi:hypothetical protein
MALITITDVIKSCIDDFPTAGGTLTFLLSGWLTNSAGKIILPSPETCSVSNVDGTFSIGLESTTDATPGTRTYSVIFSGSIDGSPVSINLGSFSLSPSPGSQDLSDLLNVGAIAGGGLTLSTLSLGSTEPRLIFVETDQGANLKNWDIDVNAGVFSLRTRTDADGAGTTFMSVVRGATTSIASMSLLGAAVGIGGTPSQGTLDVFGTAVNSATFRSTGAPGGYIRFYDSTSSVDRGHVGYGSTLFNGGPSDFGLNSAAALKFVTSGGTLALTIDQSQRATWVSKVTRASGTSLAAANNLAPAGDGNIVVVTGNTQINLISNNNYVTNDIITFKFTGTPTVKYNQGTSGANINILLAGHADFVATANSTLTLMYDGTNWVEISRSII